MKTTHDDETLRAALVGYAAELDKISAKMEAIRQQLRGRTNTATGVPAQGSPQKKHKISAAGRERIRQAQLLRWKNAKRAAA